jgi:hypothetical protein
MQRVLPGTLEGYSEDNPFPGELACTDICLLSKTKGWQELWLLCCAIVIFRSGGTKMKTLEHRHGQYQKRLWMSR